MRSAWRTGWRRGVVWAALLTVLWASGVPFGARAEAASVPGAPVVHAKAAILVDASSGQVLWSLNPHRELPMASVTKLMTLLITFQALRRGKVSLSDWVPVSDAAYRTGGSQIWLEPGERLTLKQMVTAIAVGSANDAALAVGEFLAGSTEAFQTAMNAEARRLGMRRTQFQNPHGLPAAGHYTTPADLARLARAALAYPELVRLTSQRQDRTIRNGKGGTLWLINQNRLLTTFPGADGLKTGYTSEAGFCIVASARRGSTRMIDVVLGAPSSTARFDSAASLLSYGFSQFRTVDVIRRGDVVGRIPVIRGSKPAVTVVAAQGFSVTLPRSGGAAVQQSLQLPARLGAPVARGERVGRLVVTAGGRVLGRVPLVAAQSVRAVGMPELAWRYFWRILA